RHPEGEGAHVQEWAGHLRSRSQIAAEVFHRVGGRHEAPREVILAGGRVLDRLAERAIRLLARLRQEVLDSFLGTEDDLTIAKEVRADVAGSALEVFLALVG